MDGRQVIGFQVVLDRQFPVGGQIEAETETRPVVVPADLVHLGEESAAALKESIAGEYGCLHGILHNAGVLGPRNPVVHYPLDAWREVMQVNVDAAFILTKALLGLLDASGDASVVFTSSGVGRKGRAYWGAYAASKFATEGLAEVLADEVAAAGRVRVNSLNPGGTRTAMRASAYPGEDPATLPTPEARMGLYLYLIGPDSRGVNGHRFNAADWHPP